MSHVSCLWPSQTVSQVILIFFSSSSPTPFCIIDDPNTSSWSQVDGLWDSYGTSSPPLGKTGRLNGSSTKHFLARNLETYSNSFFHWRLGLFIEKALRIFNSDLFSSSSGRAKKGCFLPLHYEEPVEFLQIKTINMFRLF